MQAVAIPIIQTVIISIRFRPRRSPKWPKNNSAERAKKKPNAEGGKGGKRSHRRARFAGKIRG